MDHPAGPGTISDRGSRRAPWAGLNPEFVRSAAAERLKALGHSDRVHIIEVLATGGRNVSELAALTQMSSTSVSRHLRVLHDAHVVACSRRGTHVLYVLADRDVARLVVAAYSGVGRQARKLLFDRTQRR